VPVVDTGASAAQVERRGKCTNRDPDRAFARAFGRVLKTARVGAGCSQEMLAERADIDRTYPSLMERGLRSPTLYVAVRLANALAWIPPCW
jgi:DNA-binding XRE family transcriptional regulator